MTKELLKEIIESDERSFLYFYASWCRNCKRMSILVDRERTPLYRINGDEYPELIEAFGIEYYPTIIEIKNKSKIVHSGTSAVRKLLK